ncbi:polyhydroxyalkanoate synthase [Limimaricola soesokkakensis]|uniref:Poly-beta-hydroxybutyrate polymerase n=1 Tax=Limimaricola soesokkakensis TaxID=1343159 RepID=A0A1X6YDA0_9RHOB|nr:class I poly(R)-hydroxyalkanoic acid synthase [Limimaricola soesokkakensis]PSK87020.1 polyhydroxyalkanoate synthase [Limimaricola soesokkakensis]SLN17731.1 Poly-beta-hydroxybutyrate polymerase [Limimaricola soesokkakensis]
MTTDDHGKDADQGETGDGLATGAKARLEANLTRIEELTQRLVGAMGQGRQVPPSLQGPSHDLYMKAAGTYWAEMMRDPARMMEHQLGYWGKTLRHYVEAQQQLVPGAAPVASDKKGDRRFSNPLWDTHPWFNFIKQQYLTNAETVRMAIDSIEGLEPREKKRLDYFATQIVDMFSPTNFLATNPDALQKALETEGQSLIDGLENLVRDLEANKGDLVVTLADGNAFRVGENLATTPGEVVFRNHLFELIQYAPQTEDVHETPVVLFPPWINKYYILDLKPQNSLIRHVVEQGYTLFVVSWINPDPSYAEIGMTDYVEDGYLQAIETVKEICGVKKVNAVGYCIAGTTLSLTLSVLKARKDNSVNSATFFTTLTDFSDQGEVGVFLDDDFVDGIEAEAREAGVLDKFYMSRTFSFLRARDLIYQPAIRSYMMGEAPPAFDLLYWNGDGTNLPARMAVEYLRGLCQQDLFATEGFTVAGHLAKISEVTVPVFAVGCESDHIAAWDSSWRGIQKMGSKDKTFVLSGSGHIAGIVNPPAKKKYGYWTNDKPAKTPEEWRAAATKHEGSWWPVWIEWLKPRSGELVPARQPGSKAHPALGPAPGRYVTGGRLAAE